MRKRRHSTCDKAHHLPTDDETSAVKAERTSSPIGPRGAEEHHAIHPSRLQQIGHPAVADPIEIFSLANPALLPGKRAQKARDGPNNSLIIEASMRKLEAMLEKVSSLDKNDKCTWAAFSSLRLPWQKLGDRLMYPDKDVKWSLLRVAHGLKSRVEAYIQHNIKRFGESSYDHNEPASGDERGRDSHASTSWESRLLSSSAVLATPLDEQPQKRRKLFSADSRSEYDLGFRQVSNTSATSNVTSASVSTSTFSSSTSIASNTEIEDFLSDLSASIQASTLQNLCPDNMRGTFCHTPDTCHDHGYFFACPEYAILKECSHDKSGSYTHFGHKHTVPGCAAHHKTDCRIYHRDGRPCRVEVVYFHVRASCMTLRGGKSCQMRPCQWGHDFEDIRRAVMRKG